MSYTLGRFLKAEWRLGTGSFILLETVRDSRITFDRDLTYTPQDGQAPATFEVDGLAIVGVLFLYNDSEIATLLDATLCGLSAFDDPGEFITLRVTQSLVGDPKNLQSTYQPVAFGGNPFDVETSGRGGRDGRPDDGQPASIALPFRIMMDPCDTVESHIERELVN